MNTEATFASLSKDHAELDQLFKSHQRALLARDVEMALALLSTFGAGLERHIDYEELRLLPVYADKDAETAGATLEIFQAEHRKLRAGLAKLTKLNEELYESVDLLGSILALLDEETMFKGLLHHHISREQHLLFPRLDELTTEEERQMWLSNR